MMQRIQKVVRPSNAKEGANAHPSTSGQIAKSSSMNNLEETKEQPPLERSAFETVTEPENLFKDDHDEVQAQLSQQSKDKALESKIRGGY